MVYINVSIRIQTGTNNEKLGAGQQDQDHLGSGMTAIGDKMVY